MTTTRRGTPSRRAIAAAQAGLLKRKGILPDEALSICWACEGEIDDRRATRAHVEPFSRDGNQSPDNFFLLCDHCHIEQPDGLDRDAQVRWLLAAEHWTVWGMRLVEELLTDLRRVCVELGDPDGIERWAATRPGARIEELIGRGYLESAGWRNGRANAKHLVAAEFRAWLLEWRWL